MYLNKVITLKLNFGRIWSCGDLDLSPVEPKTYSVYCCINVNLSTKFERNSFIHFGDNVLTRFWTNANTHDHMDNP